MTYTYIKLFLTLIFILTLPQTTHATTNQQITQATRTLQIDATNIELPTKIINNSHYFQLSHIAYALNIPSAEISLNLTGRFIKNDEYYNLRDIANHFNLRVFWVGTRDTIIIETKDNTAEGTPIFKAEPLPYDIIQIIRGSSFHDNTHFGYDFLSYLTISYIDFSGTHRIGNMIVAQEISEEVLDIFREIFEYGFPIYRMRLIDFYNAEDYLSMADNNSVSFNYRVIAGTNRRSRHAYGMAIDINPVQNPYIRGNTIWPAEGEKYLNRNDVRKGMIIPGDIVYNAFTSRGWTWGGHWSNPIDYHHFERRR